MIADLIRRAHQFDLRPREVLQFSLSLDGTPEPHGILKVEKFLERWANYPGADLIRRRTKGCAVRLAFIGLIHEDGVVAFGFEPVPAEVER